MARSGTLCPAARCNHMRITALMETSHMRRPHLFSLSRIAVMVALGTSPLVAQAPGGAPPPQQVELVGSWTMVNDEERLVRIDPGPELGNFTGFPLNAAGRQKALTWNSTIQAIPEHQ